MASPDHIQRSDVWFEEADIVLLCDDIAFKVHLQQLTASCAVFHDMASLPQPAPDPGLRETYQGMSLIRLQDAASDMRPFLKATYDSS